MVRWQTWQRLTGRRVTVTGKRAGPEFLIAPHDARPARAGSHSQRRPAHDARQLRTGTGHHRGDHSACLPERGAVGTGACRRAAAYASGSDRTTGIPCEDAAMATALLLVDVQRNTLEGNTPVPAAGQVRPVLQSLLARARTAGALVVHIQNDGPRGSPDEPQTDGWELVFPPVPGELAVRTAKPDVFTADACLATTLTARGIDRVVVAGLQSNHGVEQASRGALRHGFTVLLASVTHAAYD